MLHYLLDILRNQNPGNELPYTMELVEIIYLFLENDKKADETAFNKLRSLHHRFQNEAILSHFVGKCFQLERGVEKNDIGFAFLDEASKKNFSPAQSTLSVLYAKGLFVKSDIEHSIKLLKEAIFQEEHIRPDAYPVALFNYGYGLYTGKLYEKHEIAVDKKQGVELIKLAAGKGFPEALYIMWHTLYTFKETNQTTSAPNTLIENNNALAIAYLEMAARQGLDIAIIELLRTKHQQYCDASTRDNSEENRRKEMLGIQCQIIQLINQAGQFRNSSEHWKRFINDQTWYDILNEHVKLYEINKKKPFLIKDENAEKENRNQHIEELASLGDRDYQYLIATVYAGKPIHMEIRDQSHKHQRSLLTIQAPIDIPAATHFYSLAEQQGSFASSFELGWIYEYGLKSSRDACDFTTPMTVEHEERDFEMVKEPESSHDISSTSENKKKKDVVSEGQEETLCKDLIKALEHYKKAEKLYSLKEPLTQMERFSPAYDRFSHSYYVNGTYLFKKINTLSIVPKVRDEVAAMLKECDKPLPNNLCDLIANYHGYEGYLRRKL